MLDVIKPQKDSQSQQVKPDRREALILAAFHSIAEKGFEGLRIRGVAVQVGVNGATLHYYFPTKEDLIQAVVAYTVNRLRSVMEDLDAAGSPADKIHEHLTRLFRLMREEPATFVVQTEICLRAQRHSVMELLNQQHNQWQEMLVAILQDGIKQKIWPENMNPQDTAIVIITLLEGASLWAATDPKRGERALIQLERWLGIGQAAVI
jgi:AcrR family transcriptional regulator